MRDQLKDKNGAAVSVELDESRGAYVIRAEEKDAGRAFFTAGPAPDERIFFHTEVDEEFSGRGLASILVTEALDDSRDKQITVIPVCPLFVKRLGDKGDDYEAAGGKYRKATPKDIGLVQKTAQQNR